jgi:hypothetical protein
MHLILLLACCLGLRADLLAQAVSMDKPSALAEVPSWEGLRAAAATMTTSEFQQSFEKIYAPGEKGLGQVFEVKGSTLRLRISASEVVELALGNSTNSPAPARYWRRARELPPRGQQPALSGLHIALDPGHLGGKWAQMEERLLQVPGRGEVREGDLSLQVALKLRERLQEQGAAVSLLRQSAEPVTRQRPENLREEALALLQENGIAQPRADYVGLEGEARLLTVQWQSEKLFYRVSEIRARADLVNQRLKPDLVLCLHFNAEDWGDAKAPKLSEENHLHVMVNGCYAAEELRQPDVCYEMLQRIFGRVAQEELPLAESIAAGLAQSTGLKPYVYRRPVARQVGSNPYVWARNLLANRLYQCPVVYLEPWVMNHAQTLARLQLGYYRGKTLVGDRLESSIIEEYVQGVLQGLIQYYQQNRKGS